MSKNCRSLAGVIALSPDERNTQADGRGRVVQPPKEHHLAEVGRDVLDASSWCGSGGVGGHPRLAPVRQVDPHRRPPDTAPEIGRKP